MPHSLDRRNMLTERRQSILHHKQTDAMPRVDSEAPNAKVAWRQVIQLREENRRLRFEMEEQRTALQQQYNALQAELDKVTAGDHDGTQQEGESYRERWQEATEEHHRLQEKHLELEQRYQDLYHTFQDAVEEEAQKIVAEAARTMTCSPGETPAILQDVVKTIALQARQVEDKHLVEALYLKCEIQNMAEQLRQESQQIDEERRHLFAMQNTAREQATLRMRTLEERLHLRWKVKTIATTVGISMLLVVLQFVCLSLLHVAIGPAISVSLIIPIVGGIILATILVTPIAMLRQVYMGAPYKEKVK